MNKERRQFIQEAIDFNQGWKDMYAKKFFGKAYGRLTRQEQLDINDIIENNKQ